MGLRVKLVKRPEFLRVFLACAAFALVAWIADSVSEVNRISVPLSVVTARAAEALLTSLQMRPVREQCILSDPTGFSYQIDFACTGIIPAGLLLVAILTSVAPVRAKLAGLAIGVPSTLALNLIRLVDLFYIGVHHPRAFPRAHSPMWEAVISVFLLAFYCLWMCWVYRTTLRVPRWPKHLELASKES